MNDTVTNAMPAVTIPEKSRETYKGKNVLITGGRGYIGSALTMALNDIDCRLLLVDQSPARTWQPRAGKANIIVLHGDVAEKKTWETALPEIDYVFHLAAREYYYRSGYDPEFDLNANALPVLRLLEVCRQQKYTPKIVFSSSANLYGTVETLPVNEEHSANPLTTWAIHKLMAEHYLRLYAQKFDIPSTTLRLANVYGPTPRWDVTDRVVLNKVIYQALTGKGLTTYANQHCIRDYVFIKDVIEAFLLAGYCCESMQNPVYLIGSGEGKTISDVWQLIAERVQLNTDTTVPVRFDASVNIEPLEMRHFQADTRCFQKVTGWKPRVGLSQGIDSTIQAIQTILSESGGNS